MFSALSNKSLLVNRRERMQLYLVYNTQAGSSSKLSPISGPGQPLQIVSVRQKDTG